MVLLLLILLTLLAWLIQLEISTGIEKVPPVTFFCPCCNAAVEADWLICAHCQHRLQKSCGNCHKAIHVGQNYCPYCGNAAEKEGA